MDNLKADPADDTDPDERWEADSREAWIEVCTNTNDTQQRVIWPFKHLEDIAVAPSNEIELRAATLVGNSSHHYHFKFGHQITGSNETTSWHKEV